jgi:hypothetical protein
VTEGACDLGVALAGEPVVCGADHLDPGGSGRLDESVDVSGRQVKTTEDAPVVLGESAACSGTRPRARERTQQFGLADYGVSAASLPARPARRFARHARMM